MLHLLAWLDTASLSDLRPGYIPRALLALGTLGWTGSLDQAQRLLGLVR